VVVKLDVNKNLIFKENFEWISFTNMIFKRLEYFYFIFTDFDKLFVWIINKNQILKTIKL
jgi:hypothetical protein